MLLTTSYVHVVKTYCHRSLITHINTADRGSPFHENFTYSWDLQKVSNPSASIMNILKEQELDITFCPTFIYMDEWKYGWGTQAVSVLASHERCQIHPWMLLNESQGSCYVSSKSLVGYFLVALVSSTRRDPPCFTVTDTVSLSSLYTVCQCAINESSSVLTRNVRINERKNIRASAERTR